VIQNASTPAPGAARNLADVLLATVERDPARVLLSRRDGSGWHDVTARQFLDEVTEVARGLVASGIGPGDRVGLMAKTRYEWTLCDFAVWFAGAVTVPVYETSSASQLAWVLSASGATACFVEGGSHARLLASVAGELPALATTWSFDTVAGTPGLDDLRDAGRGVDEEVLRQRRTAMDPDTLSTIIYTSGTTGRPKGCELSHGNFLSECSAAIEALPELFVPKDASTLLFLPLAHVFGRMIEVAVVMAGCRMGHSDLARLTKDLPAFRPTFVLAVPRVFEKVYDTARRKAAADGRGRVFDLAADTAIAWSKAMDGRGPGLLLRARHAVFDRLVYAKLRAVFGGRVEWAISGGAALGPRLAHFFRGIGITILEGYGLTETTAATAVNPPKAPRVGTVGRAFQGVDVRIADDGEVQIRGGIVFPRYWQDEDSSRAAFTADGWFATGDLGAIDDAGYLSITGRKKEILVTSGGKNVAPAPLEDAVRSSPLVSQCMLVGDERPYVAALVTLDPDALTGWLAAKGRPAQPASALTEDPEVRAEVQAAVDRANAAVSSAEAIFRFRILPEDITEASGHLTPTLKVKRAVVLRDFADEVESLYAGKH
jgi:long-chain acyl-CoA synthetase